MAGIQIDVNGATASMVLRTLRIREIQVEQELKEIKHGIEQLEKIAEGPDAAMPEGERARYTVSEARIREHLMGAIPSGATIPRIMEGCGISRATAYRLLKAMQKEGQVEQSQTGYWRLIPTYTPQPK